MIVLNFVRTLRKIISYFSGQNETRDFILINFPLQGFFHFFYCILQLYRKQPGSFQLPFYCNLRKLDHQSKSKKRKKNTKKDKKQYLNKKMQGKTNWQTNTGKIHLMSLIRAHALCTQQSDAKIAMDTKTYARVSRNRSV